MKNLEKFKKSIKANRKMLIKEHGYNPATVHYWERGIKYPKYKTAMALSLILGIPINEIPTYKVERTES